MPERPDYKVLLLTSDPFSTAEIARVAGQHLDNVTVLFWAHGDMSTKPAVLRAIDATDYNLIISHINGIVLTRQHLDRAHFGAINIHPAPPEHGGVWGLHCQPVISRSVRTHHGVTLHEIDEDIDHGAIYHVKRWEVEPGASIQSVADRSFEECLVLLDHAARELSQSPDGTGTFSSLDETWDPGNRHHTIADVRRWFAALPPSHPAHRERVAFNHPRGTFSPPYFDDLPSSSSVSARIQSIRSRAQVRTEGASPPGPTVPAEVSVTSRVWFFVPQAASRLAALISFAVVANHVRPDDLGVFALISAVASGAIALGPAIVAKPLAAAKDREERERLASLAVSAAIAVAVTGFLLLSVASLVTHGLVRLTLAGAGLATLGVLTVEATYWAFVFTRGARGVGLVVAGAYALQAGATLAAAQLTDRAGLVLVPPAALAVAGVVAIALQRPTPRAAIAWYRDHRADWLPYVGGSAAGIASVQAIPLIVTATVGLTGASVFRALELAFGPTNLAATVTSNSLLAHGGDSRSETRRLYRRANIELALVAVVNGVLLWQLPAGVVRPLLGHATATLQAHAVAGSAFRVAYTVSLVGVILLVSRYTAKVVGVINVVSVVVTLLALTVGLVVGGIQGGFVALAITEAAQVTLSYVLLRRADG